MRSLVPFLVVVLVACAHAEAEPHLATRQEEPALHVETAPVARVDLPSVLDLTGTLIATDQVRVSTEVGGEVVAVRFALGDRVRKGQVLAVLDTKTSSAQAAASSAQALAQQAQLTLADQECARAEQLHAGQAVSQSRYEQALATCAAQRRAVDAANASADAARTMVDKAQVRAPFDGVIGEDLIDVGTWAGPGTAVATLFAEGALRVRIAVPEAHAAAVAVGGTVRVYPSAAPDHVVTGKVVAVGGGLRDRTRDLVVEATLDTVDPTLRPGMFARVELESSPTSTLSVPDTALRADGTARRVFVIREGRAFEVVVRTGVSRDGRTAVLSDLNEGEPVVLSAAAELTDGRRVE